MPQRCSTLGCSKYARKGGVCVSHGATVQHKRCTYDGCLKFAVRAGVCMAHGAKVKRCCIPDCTKYAVKGGVCKSHGAKVETKKCIVSDCGKYAKKGGTCISHGQGGSSSPSSSYCSCPSSPESHAIAKRQQQKMQQKRINKKANGLKNSVGHKRKRFLTSSKPPIHVNTSDNLPKIVSSVSTSPSLSTAVSTSRIFSKCSDNVSSCQSSPSEVIRQGIHRPRAGELPYVELNADSVDNSPCPSAAATPRTSNASSLQRESGVLTCDGSFSNPTGHRGSESMSPLRKSVTSMNKIYNGDSNALFKQQNPLSQQFYPSSSFSQYPGRDRFQYNPDFKTASPFFAADGQHHPAAPITNLFSPKQILINTSPTAASDLGEIAYCNVERNSDSLTCECSNPYQNKDFIGRLRASFLASVASPSASASKRNQNHQDCAAKDADTSAFNRPFAIRQQQQGPGRPSLQTELMVFESRQSATTCNTSLARSLPSSRNAIRDGSHNHQGEQEDEHDQATPSILVTLAECASSSLTVIKPCSVERCGSYAQVGSLCSFHANTNNMTPARALATFI